MVRRILDGTAATEAHSRLGPAGSQLVGGRLLPLAPVLYRDAAILDRASTRPAFGAGAERLSENRFDGSAVTLNHPPSSATERHGSFLDDQPIEPLANQVLDRTTQRHGMQ